MIKHAVVTFCGILGFVVTVVAISTLEHFTGFNLFSLSVWFVIPAGAVISGMGAASGFYLGCLWMHVRPSPFVLGQIILFSAVAQIAIYYSEYRMMTLEDGTHASALVSFPDYIQIYLSSLHMRVGRGAGVDTGEMGNFGYVMAGVQFLGFIVGGLAAYLILRSHPACDDCSLYLRKASTRKQTFDDQDQFSHFYDKLFAVPVDGDDFDMLMNWFPHSGKPKPGDVLSSAVLRECPNCRSQLVSQDVQVFAKDGWKEVPKLKRSISIPRGIDLKPVFERVTI